VLAEAAQPTPPYVYLTGGEPLILGKEVWGKDGLVEFAVGLGCAVNLNTNAVDISPEVALRLVEAGLFKVHVSLDSADAEIQDRLLAAPGRFDAVCRGIHNLQIARALLGAGHPQIHINCVLTRQNLSGFPELVRFLLEMRQTRSEEFKGKLTEDPTFQDFALHLVPVGGRENAHLRPRQAEWKTFYTQIWDEAEQVWQDYQDRIGVPAEEKKTLADHIPFANPFRRVDHGMELDEYCEAAAEGIYWQGALMPRCHVVPSQAFVLPDGSQHWCGAHAIRRPNPLGNVLQTTLRENIRRNLDRLPNLPNEFCPNCAGATCVINQTIERKLRERIAALLAKDE